MKTLLKTALGLLAMTVVVASAGAQRHMNSDWKWEDTTRWQRDLSLSTNQGRQISSVNRRASTSVRRLNGMRISGQDRALRIRSIHDQARQDILAILNNRQRDVLRNRGFDVMVVPSTTRTSTYTLRKPKSHGKHRGHGG
jgi:hypothetical protein